MNTGSGTRRVSARKRRNHKQLMDRESVRKATAMQWVGFTKFLRPWLIDLAAQYKERGVFEPMAEWILPSYYPDKKDAEVAAFVSLIVNDGRDMRSNMSDFMRLMGESPFQWFRERGFAHLGVGTVRGEKTGGTMNGRIAEYLDMLHRRWADRKTVVAEIARTFFGSDADWKVRMLHLVLSTSDAFGLGIWDEPVVRCPLTREVKRFLRDLWPDYHRYGSMDDAIALFGFERDYDFFYAAMAYREIQGMNPTGCSRFMTLYSRWYGKLSVYSERFWTGETGILPDTPFV